MTEFTQSEKYGFEDLVRIMALLRSPEGCPWDREQDHHSIRMNLLEEAYEAVEAIDTSDPVLLQEELGDVLLQVVFHARMEEEKGGFNVEDVTDGICKKLIVRHPHIFGDVKADTADQVLANWDQIKRETKGHSTHTQAMESVAKSLPSLMRAEKILSKAKKAGIPPLTVREAGERIAALAPELERGGEEAVGELLFLAVAAARALKVDPELALTRKTDRFIAEFAVKEGEKSGNSGRM